MGADQSAPSYYGEDDLDQPEPLHYVLRNGSYVRHMGDAREYWPPSSAVFRSQAPPAVEHADIVSTPGSLRAMSLCAKLTERSMLQLQADVDAQEAIRVVLNFASEDRFASLPDGAAGLGLADEGIWLSAGLGQPWKGKPFRPSKYADADGTIVMTIEVHARERDPTAKKLPEERTEIRLVPRGPDEKPGYDLEIKRQYVALAEAEYDLRELYGQAGVDATLGVGSNECVICLIEERDTAILPCRHLCLCSGCADVMRLRSQTCPICRQEIKSLLQVEGSVATTAGTPAGNTSPRSSFTTPRRSRKKMSSKSSAFSDRHRSSTSSIMSEPLSYRSR